MKLYLSAPMTGVPFNNEPLFRVAKMNLESLGHDVTSPTELDHNAGVDLSRDATPEEYETYLARDLDILEGHDGIVFLPGWEKSGGVGREGRRAIELGLNLYTWVPERPTHLWSLWESDFLALSTTKRAEVVHV